MLFTCIISSHLISPVRVPVGSRQKARKQGTKDVKTEKRETKGQSVHRHFCFCVRPSIRLGHLEVRLAVVPPIRPSVLMTTPPPTLASPSGRGLPGFSYSPPAQKVRREFRTEIHAGKGATLTPLDHFPGSAVPSVPSWRREDEGRRSLSCLHAEEPRAKTYMTLTYHHLVPDHLAPRPSRIRPSFWLQD